MNKVRIDSIDDEDTSYCISYPIEDGLLSASVERFGVLVPIGLLKGDPPRVCTGFKRIAAAKKAGIKEVPYTLLDIDEKEAVLFAISDNLKRPLNTIEKARCLEMMISRGFPRDDVFAVARMIGLPAREKTLGTVVAMASLDGSVKDLVVKHSLSLAVVEQILSFATGEIKGLLEALEGLAVTSSYLRETLDLLALLKVKKIPVDLARLKRAGDMEALLQGLKVAAYPLLSGLEEQLARIRETAALPPHIRLQVDPAFERESIEIHLRARNDGELTEALKKIETLSEKGVFRSIFELTHGTPGRSQG